ncbi:MAG TPA: transcriptional regulator, partial [Alphaproteobacteria bacterium]|nr:transcriptional regulator [Alphaproteobacteria bacterium]
RGRPPVKRPAEPVSGDVPAQPRRRGRPPVKKPVDAQA